MKMSNGLLIKQREQDIADSNFVGIRNYSTAPNRLVPRVAVEHPVVDRFAQVMGLDIR